LLGRRRPVNQFQIVLGLKPNSWAIVAQKGIYGRLLAAASFSLVKTRCDSYNKYMKKIKKSLLTQAEYDALAQSSKWRKVELNRATIQVRLPRIDGQRIGFRLKGKRNETNLCPKAPEI
jgi:hypothetical protein